MPSFKTGPLTSLTSGNVAQDSGSSSDASGGRQVHRLEELSARAVAIRDTHGIYKGGNEGGRPGIKIKDLTLSPLRPDPGGDDSSGEPQLRPG